MFANECCVLTDTLPSSNSPQGYSGSQMGAAPGQNGYPDSQQLVRPATAPKLDSIKKWSISTYKCTRQYLSEKFGKGTRTVDAELESQIQLLRDTQAKYQHVLKLAKQMNQHFFNMVQSQKHLADAFADLGMKSPELQDEFNYNSETQRSLAKNGEVLLGALSFFTSNLTTLVNKTMEDSIATVKAYEIARIEYDAYRADVEATQTLPSRAAEAKVQFEEQKERFNRLRGDLAIKLRFLEENKVQYIPTYQPHIDHIQYWPPLLITYYPHTNHIPTTYCTNHGGVICRMQNATVNQVSGNTQQALAENVTATYSATPCTEFKPKPEKRRHNMAFIVLF